MHKGRKIVVVVPAHNEENFIGGVIATMPDFVDAIVVVDDCSSDRTAERAIAQHGRRVHVVHTEKQTGVGGATKLGYVEALSQAADVIVKMDGDGQMPPGLLAPLIDPLVEEGYSYSKGNRLSKVYLVGTVVADRLFDVAVLVLFALLLLMTSPAWSDISTAVLIAGGSLLLAGVAVLLLMKWRGGVRLVAPIASWLPVHLRSSIAATFGELRAGL